MSIGRVFFCWLLWGDVCCVQGSSIVLLAVMGDVYCVRRSGILLLAVMGGCWLSPWVGYPFADCYGGMLVEYMGRVFFCWLFWRDVGCV